MNTFNSFFKQFSILAGIILLISIAIDLFVPKIQISYAYPYLIVALYLITLGIFYMLSKSIQSRLSRFANTYMLVNFGKLIFFLIIILSYSYLNREDAVSFMLTFFSYYFIFTSFEIVALLKMKK